MLIHCMTCIPSTTTERSSEGQKEDQEIQEQRHHQGANILMNEREQIREAEWIYTNNLYDHLPMHWSMPTTKFL